MTLGSLYLEAQGCVPLLLENLINEGDVHTLVSAIPTASTLNVFKISDYRTDAKEHFKNNNSCAGKSYIF